MTVARTLLERIASPKEGSQRDLGDDLEDVRASICLNLQRIFNTYHGGSPATPNYGISSFADHLEGPTPSNAVAKEIRDAIVQFEPRLTNVEVTFVQSENERFELRFDIIADIVDESDAGTGVFRSVIEPTGHIRIRQE